MLPFSADLWFVLCVISGIRKYADLKPRQVSSSGDLASQLSKRSICPWEGLLGAIGALDFQKSADGQFRRKAMLYFLWLHVAENSGA